MGYLWLFSVLLLSPSPSLYLLWCDLLLLLPFKSLVVFVLCSISLSVYYCLIIGLISTVYYLLYLKLLFLLLYPTIFIIKGIFLNLPCKEKEEKKFLLVQELSRTFLLINNILFSPPF